MPLRGKPYDKFPKVKAEVIRKVVPLDGPRRKVNPQGKTWMEMLFGSGKRK